MLNSPYSKENVRLGIMHYLFGRGLAGVAGFATVILLVRYMDVQSYAGFTALSGITALAGILAGLGLERAISRFIPEARLERSAAELGKFIWCITAVKLIAALLVSGIFYSLWQLIIKLFSDVHLIHFPMALLCFVVAETLFQHFSAVFQALLKQKALTRILAVQWAGRLAMIMWATFTDSAISLEESLLIMAVPEMLGVLVFVLALIHYLSQLNADQEANKQLDVLTKNGIQNWPDWSAVARMAGHNYSFTLLAAPPQGYFMKMLAAIFLPTQMVAAYGFFISIAERVRQYIPLHLLYGLIEPVMIGHYVQNRSFSILNQRCQLLYKSNLILLIPLFAWILAAGGFIVSSLTGGKYQEYQYLLLLVMLQLPLGSHVVLLQLILNSVGESALLIRAGLYGLMAMGLFLAITIPINVQFLVFSPLVFSVTCNLFIISALQSRAYPYKLSWQLYIKVIGAGIIACVVTFMALKQTLFVMNQSLIVSISSGLLVAIIYSMSLYLFKTIDSSEVDLLKSILQKSSRTRVQMQAVRK